MWFSQWINKSDTQETADASIASEDAVAQNDGDDDSSRGNSRSIDCDNREKGRRKEKLFDITESRRLPDWNVFVEFIKNNWYEFAKKNLRLIVGVGVVLFVVGVIIIIVESKDSAVPVEEDRFDFSDLEATENPTMTVVIEPAIATSIPTSAPSAPTSTPKISTPNPTSTHPPTKTPSASPSSTPSTAEPTVSSAPSSFPSFSPTYVPTIPAPPVPKPPVVPFKKEEADSILTFCVIADAPYTQMEVEELPIQIATQMEGCEFLIHLGDIFIGDTPCNITDYQAIHNIMLESHAPAFLVPGDNEWNDCTRGNIDVGWDHWTNHFVGFEDNWNHTFSIVRQPGYEENFYFIEKRTLFIGLNIVGGRVHNSTEWKTRLGAEFDWVSEIMMDNLVDTNTTDGVILMAHAHPSDDHGDFFHPFRVFLRDELENEFPVLYLHGDGHNFMYTPNYLNQSNFLRIQHEGGTLEPVLKIMASPGRGPDGRSSVYDAFQFDRQLELMKKRNEEKDRKKKEE